MERALPPLVHESESQFLPNESDDLEAIHPSPRFITPPCSYLVTVFPLYQGEDPTRGLAIPAQEIMTPEQTIGTDSGKFLGIEAVTPEDTEFFEGNESLT